MRTVWRYKTAVLAAAAVVAVAAVLTLPATRWIAWRQLRSQIPRMHRHGDSATTVEMYPSTAEARRAAARYPRDVGIQIVAITGFLPTLTANSTTSVSELRNLRRRFPDSPFLYATILNLACPKVSPGYREREFYPPAVVAHFGPPERPREQNIADYVADARAGERCDSQNAFFPFMCAIALIAGRQDGATLAALSEAAAKPVWRDYLSEAGRARMRLCEEGLGSRSALDLDAVVSDPGFRMYAQYRSLARVLAGLAERAEDSGRPGEALAIRQPLMRCAALIRAQSTTAIGSLVAVAMFQIAMTSMKHFGEDSSRSLPLGNGLLRQTSQREQHRVRRYAARLQSQGHTDAARWVVSENASEARARDIICRGLDRDPLLLDLQRP